MAKILSNRRILVVILLGLAVRLLLSFLPGFKIDVDDWFAWSDRLSSFNFSQFYSKEVFTDYTPGYLYILSILGFLKNLLQLPDNIFYLILKLPAIISDIVIGLLVYKEIRKHVSTKAALFVLVLILFNPVVIFNSSVWGQIDSILTLLIFATIITLKNNNFILSSLLFGLALLVKPQALTIAPLMILFLLSHFKLSNLFKLSIPFFLLIFILTFPFFPNQTLIKLTQHISNTANEYPYTSLNAYNFWGIIGFWINDSQLWNSLSYQTWGYILFISYTVMIGYFFFTKRLSIYTMAALAILGFFFLPTRVHERYLYPAIVFLILVAILLKSRLILLLTASLTTIQLLNLYYVYVYYNEIYFKLPKLLYHPLIYNILANNSKSLSLISTIIFILISVTIINHELSQKEN